MSAAFLVYVEAAFQIKSSSIQVYANTSCWLPGKEDRCRQHGSKGRRAPWRHRWGSASVVWGSNWLKSWIRRRRASYWLETPAFEVCCRLNFFFLVSVNERMETGISIWIITCFANSSFVSYWSWLVRLKVDTVFFMFRCVFKLVTQQS